jgi:ketosteroid isomerase-like protein
MTTTTGRTRATVQDFLGRITEGAPDRTAALFAEKADWEIAENPTVPWIRPRSTRADVADHFRAALAEGQAPDQDATTVDMIVVEGTESTLTGQLAGTVGATGRSLRSPFAMWLTVEDGLITRYRVCEDSLAIAAARTGDSA